jgi:hypothetical protein
MAKPLKTALSEALAEFDALDSSSLRQDSPQFQEQLTSLIQKWLLLQTAINSNFSTNETLEDVSTSELKYIAVDYYIAQLYSKLTVPSKQHNLKKSILLYLSFLTRLRDYELLSKTDAEKLANIKENPFEIANLHASAMLRRDEKIANYKLERSLTEKLSLLDKLESNEQDYENIDEDTLRELYLEQVCLFRIKSFDNIRLVAQELEILEHIPDEPKLQEVKEDDERENRSKDPTEFTDKLEKLDNVNEYLSKDGKILKPFTILKREDLRKKVYGTGQYLPTMTVEDYLEQELANGGMVSSAQEPEESSDEDDYEKNDRDTYKARQWDDFTDTHRKGSGNTINRG